jgi:Na+/H+ antiporter NhaD/arsenite permease-like protein
VEKVWPIWLLGLSLVLAVFFCFDTWSDRKWVRKKPEPRRPAHIEIRGTQNFFFLFIILVAVFAKTPVREVIMIAAAAAAHRFSGKAELRSNEFSFAPIKEVAILFAGIFATMVPALDWLALNAGRLGIRTPGQYYWSTGILSSFLDNAPTYLNFLSAAMGLHQLTLGNPEHMKLLLTEHAPFLQAVSTGAVFFGACTYIGNGPNFMVKSIAEHHGVKCPSFFGYIVWYTLPVLIPIFTLIWFLFFK